MQDVTSRFLYLCRPRGKPLPKSDVIKTEAWALRRLVSIFGGVTRRPHIPRDKQLRKLFSCVGIDVDQGSGPAEENDEHYDEGGECEESEAAWTDDECVEDQDLTDQHQPDIAAKDGGNEGSHKFVTKSIVSRESLSRGFSSESMVPSPSYTVTPPPRPRQSTESPLSAPKHHEPVKCGWICTTCKTAHRFKEKVMETPCFDEEKGHALVESPLMCNRCFTLSDSVRALSTKLCPSLHCEDDLVEKTVPQVVPKRPVPPVPKFEAKQVQENIQAAEKEMRRLKLLQMVHWERQRLAELVAKKNKGGIDNVDTLPMCDEEIQRLAGIEASAPSPSSAPVPKRTKAGDDSSLLSASTLVLGEVPKQDAASASPVAKDVSSRAVEGNQTTEQTPEQTLQHMPAKHTQQREATDPVEPHPPAEAAERTPVLEESEVTAKATATQPNSKQEPATNQQVASALIESEPCISPEEQKRNLGKGEPKRKGRPPKNPSAAAKAKAKAKSQAKKASKPTAKAKAKASAGAKKTHASKADSPAPSVAPEDEPDITAGSSSDANAKPASNRTKKPRTSKEEGDAKPTPSSKPQAKSRSAKPTKKDNKNTKCKDDKKALLSRKSCAYKKARREALQSGKTPEEANSAAKKAYAETK